MEKTHFDIDPELLNGFIDDSLDELEAVGGLFVQLESQPDNHDLINAIFRPVHSIKGNAAFFGLMKLKKLAHELESLLDDVRKNKLVLQPDHVTLLLEGLDWMKGMLRRTRRGEAEIDDPAVFDELLERIVKSRRQEGDLLAQVSQIRQRLEGLRELCAGPEGVYLEQLNQVIHLATRACGAAGPAAGPQARGGGRERPRALGQLAALLESLADKTVSDAESRQVLDLLMQLRAEAAEEQARAMIDRALDEYRTMVDAVGFDPLLGELLSERVKALDAMPVWQSAAPSPAGEAAAGAPSGPARETAPAARESHGTMRVSEESVENFLGYVGELIVIGEMYHYLQSQTENQADGGELAVRFKRVNDAFNRLSLHLQQSIMEIRRLPVRTLLGKAPRIVRDVATASGKSIQVRLEGEGVLLDKSLIELLDAPLVHIVRNAADHGIESPAERQAAGKEPQGVIHIAVTETEATVTLSVRDDGRGLNLDAIRRKAIALGLIGEAAPLGQEHLVDLLFAAGVSTAQSVTEISGRGVGLDIVKRNITEAHGSISVHSDPGRGCEFSITLPKAVTTQIIEGYLIRLADNRYIVPLDRVREVFSYEAGQITRVAQRGECILRHETLLPVIRLFGAGASGGESRPLMLCLKTAGATVALCVDEVLGIQRVVLNELEGLMAGMKLYQAAAVMGDGTVAMVLNTDHLAGGL